jgi:hypothetical protein
MDIAVGAEVKVLEKENNLWERAPHLRAYLRAQKGLLVTPHCQTVNY